MYKDEVFNELKSFNMNLFMVQNYILRTIIQYSINTQSI